MDSAVWHGYGTSPVGSWGQCCKFFLSDMKLQHDMETILELLAGGCFCLYEWKYNAGSLLPY